jgi:tetratricopeptide repeat protein
MRAAANALGAANQLVFRRDDLDGANEQLQKARDISARIGDSLGEANALHALGDLARRRDDLEGAKELFEKARISLLELALFSARRMRCVPSAIWRAGAMISKAQGNSWRKRGISLEDI